MFIVKSNAAVGWYARGFDHPDAVKTLTIPLTADTVFRVVHTSRHATRGHVTHSPGTAQALARLGGDPQGVLAVPLILRDKVAAVLYCDTPQDEMPPATADLVEILVSFAGKVIDVLSAPRARRARRRRPGGTSPRAAPRRRPPPRTARAPAALPIGTRHDPAPAGARFRAPAADATSRRGAAPAFTPLPRPARARPPPTPPARALAPEDQKAHDDAKRFARLVVSEIKLYNEAKVTEGRKTRDIYERLKEDIERGRQMYHDRVSAGRARLDRLLPRRAGADPRRGRRERPRTHVGARARLDREPRPPPPPRRARRREPLVAPRRRARGTPPRRRCTTRRSLDGRRGHDRRSLAVSRAVPGHPVVRPRPPSRGPAPPRRAAAPPRRSPS